MRDFLAKIKELCDLLGAAGCRIPEEDHILYILGGLSHDYDSVIVTVTAKTHDWTVQDVAALLHSFESRLEDPSAQISKINIDGSVPSVNLAHTSGGRKDGFHQGRGGGSNFNRNGGGRGSVFRGGRSGGFRGRGNGRLICQLCQKPGHSSDRCWYRFEPSFMPHPPSHHRAQHQQLHSLQPPSQLHSNQPVSQPQQPPSANLAQSRNASSYYSPSEFNTESSSWYPDSGATHHVSNDLANLNTASEYHGSNSTGHP